MRQRHTLATAFLLLLGRFFPFSFTWRRRETELRLQCPRRNREPTFFPSLNRHQGCRITPQCKLLWRREEHNPLYSTFPPTCLTDKSCLHPLTRGSRLQLSVADVVSPFPFLFVRIIIHGLCERVWHRGDVLLRQCTVVLQTSIKCKGDSWNGRMRAQLLMCDSVLVLEFKRL